MKKLDVLAAVLVAVGALNWGLVAVIFGMKFGETSMLSSGVYGVVGLAGVYQAFSWKAVGRRWYGSRAPVRAR
jgi:uncharacterized membrane protein YuzA (DUF378 family)